jgi:hypothetical protein
MNRMQGRGPRGGGRTPTTVPPPFDPEEYARDSELALRVAPPASDMHETAEVNTAPPLNKRVQLNVPLSELAWFDLSEDALTLAAKIDGTKTLHELMDSPDCGIEAVSQLHDTGLLDYEA